MISDIESYLRSRGVTRPYAEFRAKLEERCRAVGVPIGDVTINHWIFQNLVEQWSRENGKG